MRVGVSGVGRIGRSVVRQLWLGSLHEVVLLNEPRQDAGQLAYLLQHDTVYGRLPAKVAVIGEHRIAISNDTKRWELEVWSEEAIPAATAASVGVDCLVDSSGQNWSGAELQLGRDCLPAIVITRSSRYADLTLVYGLNEQLFSPGQHRVVAASICDAVAIAPILGLLAGSIGIEHCFVTTLHPWLPYQKLLDAPLDADVGDTMPEHVRYALGRASVGSLIPKPTTVGATLEGLVPKLEGRVSCASYRVPTASVCCADISVMLSNRTTTEGVERLLRSLPERIVTFSDEPLVSTDYAGTCQSSTVDLRWLVVNDERFLRTVLWYDNEWGYAARVADIIDALANTKPGDLARIRPVASSRG